MRLPAREDFLDYVEGAPIADAEVQRNILKILASSAIHREQCAEMKRDLYLVEVQVPEYRISPDYAAELTKLAESWLKLHVMRKYGFRGFTRTKEFMALVMGLLVLVGLMLVALLWKH